MVFSTQKLCKVRVIALSNSIDLILKSLEKYGAIQITQTNYVKNDSTRPYFQQLSTDLVFLRAAQKTLGIKQPNNQIANYPRNHVELTKKVEKFRQDFVWLKQAVDAAINSKNESSKLKTLIDTFEPLKTLEFPPSLLKNNTVELYYAQVKVSQTKYLSWIKQQKISATLLNVNEKNEFYSVSAIEKSKIATFTQQASKYLANRIIIPDEFSEKTSFARIFFEIEEAYLSAQRKHQEAILKVNDYLKFHSEDLTQLIIDLEMEAKIAELPNKFSKTQLLTLIEGWIERSELKKFDSEIEKCTNGMCLVEKIKTNELAPTKLKNPPVARRFEFLVRFFSLPKSNEIDPTMVMFFTFPLIFGMVLGDVGYGLLGVVLAIILYKKYQSQIIKGASIMMFLSSIIAIIFGFVYGEIFGVNSFLFLNLTPIIERGGNGIAALMAFALVIGVIHLALGYGLSIYDNLKHRHVKHAIARAAWLGLEISFVFLGALILNGSLVSAALLNISTNSLNLSFGVFAVVCLVLIVFFEGPMELIEIPTLISNILSYLRIMALGLSGTILARIIDTIPVGSSLNSLMALTTEKFNLQAIAGAFFVLVVFSILMILGQTLSFGLAMFEASIQTLRLHYVEFFSKFFKGGGIPFIPLREIE